MYSYLFILPLQTLYSNYVLLFHLSLRNTTSPHKFNAIPGKFYSVYPFYSNYIDFAYSVNLSPYLKLWNCSRFLRNCVSFFNGQSLYIAAYLIFFLLDLTYTPTILCVFRYLLNIKTNTIILIKNFLKNKEIN